MVGWIYLIDMVADCCLEPVAGLTVWDCCVLAETISSIVS